MTSSLDSFNFFGRRVLVTGGGRGIGLAVVKLFCELKATVFVFDKDQDSLAKLKIDLPDVQGIHVDLADWEATRKETEKILPIHHLVNNAALLEYHGFLNTEQDYIDRMFAVNYKAVVNVSKVVSKGMIKWGIDNGTIVNLGSIADKSAIDTFAVYGSTKAAVAMLSRSMAFELGQFGIRVNYVRPTMVNTKAIQEYSVEQREGLTKMVTDKMIIKRLAEPKDVAQSVIILSSTWASMVTGNSITVDGGYEVA